MNEEKKRILRQFIDYYFASTGELIDSLEDLAERFDTSVGQIRSLVNVFIDCGYLYRDNMRIKIYDTKRSFSNDFEVHDKQTYYLFTGETYSVSLNKFELKEQNKDFDVNDIKTINDLIFELFVFTITFKVIIKPSIYDKNGKLWLKKECYCNSTQSILYMCEFTQGMNSLHLTNPEVPSGL